MYGILNFKWFKKKVHETYIFKALESECEYAEREARICQKDISLYRVYNDIPVVITGVTNQLENDRFVGIRIEVLTGYGKGIRHFMDPVTDLALKEVVTDIMETKPWGIPWASKPTLKEGIYYRREFDKSKEKGQK